MPVNKEQFLIIKDDLQKEIDVDDGVRSCPINMDFVDEGYINKAKGCALFGSNMTELLHSLYHFKKKDSTSYILGVSGTKMYKYNTSTTLWEVLTSGAFTVTIASPAVFSQTAHGLKAGSKITFSTTGALPTGLTAGTTYYVIAAGLTADAFEVSTSLAGSAVNTSGTQSGTHTITRLYTSGSQFGYMTYDDNLYFGNTTENYTKFTGTAFTEYDTAPKGNIMEVFEDRMFVSGVLAEPLSVYYSKTSDPTDFTVASGKGGVIKPLGTDFVTNLQSYYSQLLVFKADSIWKISFVYDSTVSLFVPKLELQSGNYGACSRQAVSWVENDLWFFTGREVRSIGYRDQQLGVLGVNSSVISDQIKETLYTVPQAYYSKVVVFYNNRRFYLAVALNGETTNDTLFVCHLLYKAVWTKYTGRILSDVEGAMIIDNTIYTAISHTTFGCLVWSNTLLNDVHVEPIYKETFATDPASHWTIGGGWIWDSVNHNMKPNV